MIFLCPFLHCKALRTAMYKRYVNIIIIIIIIMVQHIIRVDVLRVAQYFFRALQGRGKIRAMSKMSIEKEVYYSTTKKIVVLQLASIFLVRVFRNILIPSVRITLIMRKMFARIICQTIESEVDYLTAKEKCYLGFCFLVRVSKTSDSFSHSCSFFIRRYSPYCKPVKPGHYSVLRPRILHVLLTLYGK